MARPSVIQSFVLLVVAVAVLTVRVNASEVDRLGTLARVWAAVKYLHPYLMQKEIDWDGAVVRAIPRVRAAATDDDFASAVGSMLSELGDPATRVIKDEPASKPAPEVSLYRRVGDTLVINAGPYAAAKSGMALLSERATLMKETAKARQVLLDIRHHSTSQEEVEVVRFALSQLSGLTGEVVAAPASVYVHHSGYRPQKGGTSGGYYSGLLTVPGQTFSPLPGAAAPSRVVFVTNSETVLPAIALALRDAGKALIVSDAPLDDRAVVNTKAVDLVGGWRAVIRLEQMSTDVRADVIASDPMAEALAILEGKKPAPSVPPAGSSRIVAEPRWRPDADYRDMVYPDLGHRLLAAFRIWSVIQYFYPYKALIGDWDVALTEAIPQFIAARNADEYALAVAEMVARVEDGHSGAFGHPSLATIFGTWQTPIEVREVEKEFVVTGLHARLPADVDVRLGDVVLSVDGESFGARMERLWKYRTASTETARRNRVAETALSGPKGSTATLGVRGANQRERLVRVPRMPGRIEPRHTGEPYRVIEGNIGYVDLTRLTVPQVDAMFDALKSTGAIIFDMRGYPNGTAWSIAPRINTKGARTGAVFRRVQVSGASSFEESASGFYFEQPLPTSDKPKYMGRTVMLIDDRAISQSEHTCLFFEAASDITFIGTPTAGANGDVTSFFVPGGFRVSFSGHDVRHADGRQLQRVGIQPHVRVAPTIQGIRSGRDEVLERAIAHLQQRPRDQGVPGFMSDPRGVGTPTATRGR